MNFVRSQEGVSLCDKCGRPVDPKNDAIALQAILFEQHGHPDKALWLAFTGISRHLLPTEDCEGSPSRAQYLEGQPRDSRPEYPYVEAGEPLLREAYAKLQTWTPPEGRPLGGISI